MKKALITGILGQDGNYLSELLLEKGYKVYGITRYLDTIPEYNSSNIEYYNDIDITSNNALSSLITKIKPDEIYHLAAYHFSSQNDENKNKSFDKFYKVNLFSTNEILETIQKSLPNCRLFYASSCHVFGNPEFSPQNEKTPFRPNSLYSITKSAGTNLCQFYREHYNLFTCVGILYNHESPRRSRSFVSHQIAETAAKASVGISTKLVLQNLDAKVDWGSASDYVRAMWLTLQQPLGDDYIISSGTTHSIREFAKIAFDLVGLNYLDYIYQKPQVNVNNGISYFGDCTKISKTCNWNPVISFKDLIHQMVEDRISNLKNHSI